MAKKKSARSASVSKKGTGKFKRSGSARSASAKSGRSTGRSRSVKAAAPSGHALIDVVCSECFTELAFDTGVRSDGLECPICGHASDRPDDGTLNRISGLRKSEKTNAMIAIVLTLVAVVGFTAWAVLQINPVNADDGAKYWGPLGVSLLCVFVLMGFSFKYEGNRWETYF